MWSSDFLHWSLSEFCKAVPSCTTRCLLSFTSLAERDLETHNSLGTLVETLLGLAMIMHTE